MKIKQIISKLYQHVPKTVLKHIATPRNIIVEPVAGCNLVCSACPQDQLERPYGKMSFEDFRTIINKIKPKNIGLYFMGEPFLNPRIFDMIRYANYHGVRTVVNTNSTTLYRDFDQIAASKLDKITLSLDGVTQETMEKYRHNINAEQVLKGIKLLSMACEDYGPEIEVRTLLFYPTLDELPLIEIFLNQCNLTNHRLIEPIITGWGGKQNPDIETLGDGRVKNMRPRVCPSLFRVAVTWDGWVLPCCNDVHASVKFGNILTEDFDKIIWGSKLWLKKAKRMFPICYNCYEDE